MGVRIPHRALWYRRAKGGDALAINWSNVVDIAPELSDIPVNSQNAILNQVNSELSTSVWGTKIEIGRAWLAAHLATVSSGGGAGGQVLSEKVGDVSRTYSDAGATGASSSDYGQEFERLLLQLPAARFSIG